MFGVDRIERETYISLNEYMLDVYFKASGYINDIRSRRRREGRSSFS